MFHRVPMVLTCFLISWINDIEIRILEDSKLISLYTYRSSSLFYRLNYWFANWKTSFVWLWSDFIFSRTRDFSRLLWAQCCTEKYEPRKCPLTKPLSKVHSPWKNNRHSFFVYENQFTREKNIYFQCSYIYNFLLSSWEISTSKTDILTKNDYTHFALFFF